MNANCLFSLLREAPLLPRRMRLAVQTETDLASLPCCSEAVVTGVRMRKAPSASLTVLVNQRQPGGPPIPDCYLKRNTIPPYHKAKLGPSLV